MSLKHLWLLLLLLPSLAIAQHRSDVFVDVGITEPGLSATYGRRLTRHLDVGGGIHFYDVGWRYNNQLYAAFADIRPNWRRKHSMFFLFADAGISVVGGKKALTSKVVNPDLYLGLGLGYCYIMNKRGMGPYVSLGLDGNKLHTKYDYDPTFQSRDYWVFDVYALLSVGFKL